MYGVVMQTGRNIVNFNESDNALYFRIVPLDSIVEFQLDLAFVYMVIVVRVDFKCYWTQMLFEFIYFVRA